MIKDIVSSHAIKIIVLSRSVEEEDASISDVIIVIQGTEVLLGAFTHGLHLLPKLKLSPKAEKHI